jgi:hypothetical protein
MINPNSRTYTWASNHNSMVSLSPRRCCFFIAVAVVVAGVVAVAVVAVMDALELLLPTIIVIILWTQKTHNTKARRLVNLDSVVETWYS